MKKKTRLKIIRILIAVALVLIISTGLIIYHILGPMRSFFWNLPYLGGFLGSKTYLVLLQNNNELRPTGGFITAVAEVGTTFGFTSVKVSDSYQIPDPSQKIPAPDPFNYFIGKSDPFFAGWTLRDANFSPDFAVSSRDIIELYHNAYPDKTIDGIVAIDFFVIEELLNLYGPITVEDTVFTSENFFIESQRVSKNIDTHDPDQLAARKDIVKPFMEALKSTILHTPSQYGNFFRLISALGQEKHVMAYSSSDSFQAKLEEHGLSNTLHHSDQRSDFLHLNIANIGGRKADRYVTKDIKYRADFSDPNNHLSILTITFDHLGSYNIQSDIYQAYVRVYSPFGSQLVASSGSGLQSTKASTDLNLTVFSNLIRLRPGESTTLSYQYRLPDLISPSDYRLHIVKQGGIQNQQWQVAVREENDTSMNNITALKEDITPLIIRENLALWKGEFIQDLFFHVAQTDDSSGPIVLWQQFEDLSTITIRFNEQIDTTTALDPNNYLILDLNEANSQTDEVTVEAVRFGGDEQRDLRLEVSGVTNQPEEHYQLTLRNIQDREANPTEPSPLLRTLVQRISE
ncbi:MAG: DUF4012 domain-containing protein [bacterium]|nr:DUF4012 domain-containing protein [bacterium]